MDNPNTSTRTNRPSTPAVSSCKCVRCDPKAKAEYLNTRFPDGMVEWSKLEDEIVDRKMELKEGFCSREREFDPPQEPAKT